MSKAGRRCSRKEHVDIILSSEGDVSNESAAKGGGPIGDGAASVDATKSEFAAPATDTVAASEATDAGAGPVAPAVKKPGMPKQRRRARRNHARARPTQTEVEEDKGVQRLLRESARVKQDFVRTVSAAEELRSVIRAGGDFRWAQDNVQGDTRLASCTAALRSKLTDWPQNSFAVRQHCHKGKRHRSADHNIIDDVRSLAPHIAQLISTIRHSMAAMAAMPGE